MRPARGSVDGKNCCAMLGARNAKTTKSYHSRTLPTLPATIGPGPAAPAVDGASGRASSTGRNDGGGGSGQQRVLVERARGECGGPLLLVDGSQEHIEHQGEVALVAGLELGRDLDRVPPLADRLRADPGQLLMPAGDRCRQGTSDVIGVCARFDRQATAAAGVWTLLQQQIGPRAMGDGAV